MDGKALLRARNSATDSGRPQENVVEASAVEVPQEIALKGLKRAQEALRVLEEYAKCLPNGDSQAFARLRFELYAHEQWLVLGSDAARVLAEARLYVLLSGAQCPQGLEAVARAVLKGGATVLQLREKDLDGAAQVDRARRLLDICGEHRAVLVVNDRADVALAAGAPCVHLGQGDLALPDLRRIAGAGLLAGRSTHSAEQARHAVEQEGADYIAIGAMYPTATKQGYQLKGLELARQVAGLELEVPVFAIGGITLDRVGELKAAGVKGIAVSSAVVAASDPERAAGELLEALAA